MIECRQLIAEQSRVGVQAVCARAGGHAGRCMTRAELVRDTDFVARVERERDELRAEVERLTRAYRMASEAAEGLVMELGRVRRERTAVIDCVNLYGDATLHSALTDAGLLNGPATNERED